ncbi:hypothetical protein IQ254_05215 [Nodosilinea sp. LEGE 07088]|uniref:hypothetical protein n=1 Tax=Nodosilinea sp. LEGE 07088 TaxID=2777968 RepID=UPI0019F3A6A8|nr:hypothetical protein [Nodosilinea sp. LEGE 07088]MBE9136605.1 hypothetical protein [Nodosilinea sp. LEGE 07088]
MPAQLAQGDSALAHMLEQLKRCGMHRYPLHQRLWVWVRSQWRRLKQVLTTQLN